MFTRREFLRMTGATLATPAITSFLKAPYAETLLQPESRPVYFGETGHHLSGDFLEFWRRSRNGYLFGLPITEQMQDMEGWNVQYFQNVRLEQNPDNGYMQLGALGLELFRANNWEATESEDPVPFRFAERHLMDFGMQIGREPVDENEHIQYTQRISLRVRNDNGRLTDAVRRSLEFNKSSHIKVLWPDQIVLEPLGSMLTELHGINTEGVQQGSGSQRYDPTLNNRQKHIEINLTEQKLVAYEGDFAVFNSAISSGRRGRDTITPTGAFSVYSKEPLIDYRGWDGNKQYFQPDVPYNLKFYPETYIHGTYWHDQFGTSSVYGRSLGCVNLDPYDAKWLYDWTPLQTPVRVRY